MHIIQWLRKTKKRYVMALVGVVLLCLLVVPETQKRTTARDRLAAITHSGTMTVGVIKHANHFFYINEQATGLVHDLLQKIGDHLGVAIVVREFTSVQQLHAALQTDIIRLAMGMKQTLQQKTQFVQSIPYLQSHLYLVRFKQDAPAKKGTQMTAVIPSRYASLFDKATFDKTTPANKPDFTWLYTNKDYNAIFTEMSAQQDTATVLDAFDLAVYRLLYPKIQVAKTLPQEVDYAFLLLRLGNERLLSVLNAYITHLKKTHFLRTLYRRYYAYNQISNRHNADAFLTQVRNTLPQLRPYFEQASLLTGFDASLLAAIAYQESKWREEAVSPTGVKGIMMLTHAAAKDIGVTDRTDIEQSIIGGAQYLQKVLDKVPERVVFPDRLWFALASYNIGFGHLEDARKLTQKAGYNPDIWDNVVRFLPRLSQPEWHYNTRYGYARGKEAVVYVRNIRRFYDVLRHIDDSATVLSIDNQ